MTKDFNVIIGDDFDRSDVDQWCRQMWNALKEGGRWGIPRSGLIFAKQNGQLVLVAAMPHMAEMPITAEQLKLQQDSDFNATVDRFGRVGVTVIRQAGV
jgi:hypothetical protein